MSATVDILHWPGAPAVDELASALVTRGMAVRTSSGKEPVDDESAADDKCVVLVPVHAAGKAALDLKNIGDVLSRSFTVIKQVAVRFEDVGRPVRLVILLPGDLAMGAPGNAGGGAITGALLSLARTLSLELKKSGGTVNAILYGEECDAGGGVSLAWPEDLAEAVVSLGVRNSGAINGQELFVLSASDVGRLHP